MWVYLKSKGEELWTVGFYRPDGKWEPQGDYTTEKQAADSVHYLNGGTGTDTTGGLFS